MTEETTIPYLKIHPDDNVLVALKDLSSGTAFSLENEQLTLLQEVPAKHKFFINNMKEGDRVIMYGTLVGKFDQISKGGLMTTENTKHAAGSYAYRGFNIPLGTAGCFKICQPNIQWI